MEECIASEMILTEPLIIPTVSFSMIRKEFEIIESRAVLTFKFILNGIYQDAKIDKNDLFQT